MWTDMDAKGGPRMCRPDGTSALLLKGPDGFATVQWPGESSMQTEVPNLMLEIKPDPIKKRPSAAPKAKEGDDDDDEYPVGKDAPNEAEGATAEPPPNAWEIFRSGQELTKKEDGAKDLDKGKVKAAADDDNDDDDDDEPLLGLLELYFVKYFSATNSGAVTLKVGKKPDRFKQQFSFGGKSCKLSREEIQAIGREAIAKLKAGEDKKEVKKWAQSRCV